MEEKPSRLPFLIIHFTGYGSSPDRLLIPHHPRVAAESDHSLSLKNLVSILERNLGDLITIILIAMSFPWGGNPSHSIICERARRVQE